MVCNKEAFDMKKDKTGLYKKISESRAQKFVVIVEPWVTLLFFIAGLSLAVWFFVVARSSWTEQRILISWQLLTTTTSGSSGKAKALEFLAKQNVDLHGIDLGKNKEQVGTYLSNVKIPNIHMRESNLSGAILTDANLSGSFLAGSNFERVNFSGADLSGSHMVKVSLISASMQGTNLSNAILRKADLRLVDFEGADLTGADLRYANTYGANFTGATLIDADLNEMCGDQSTRGLPEKVQLYRCENNGKK